MTSAPTPAPVRRGAVAQPVSRPDRYRTLLRGAVRPLIWVGLVLLAIAVLYPLLWMVFSSFKDDSEVFNNPWGLPGEAALAQLRGAGKAGVVRYFTNSVIVTSASIVTTTSISAWAAYGLVRLRIPFGGPVLLLLLGGLMVAPTVALIPLFGLLQRLGIFDTYWALIVLYTAFRIPFTTFLIRGLHARPLARRRRGGPARRRLTDPDLLAHHPADVPADPRLRGDCSRRSLPGTSSSSRSCSSATVT